MTRALVIIDVQNDYFPGGNFPLHAAEAALGSVLRAARAARKAEVPVVLVQHVAEGGPFLSRGTQGAEIHPALKRELETAPVVIKAFADAFHQTKLEATLREVGANELVLCGMMSHNCVTHTALSKAAEKYPITVLSDASTTVSEVLHQIALHALSTRIAIKSAEEAFGND